MQHEIGQMILRDLSDPRIDPARTSVTRVTVQEDLLQAKVFVSVYGTESEQKKAMAALGRAAGHVRGLLMERMRIRVMPAIEFLVDEQFKGALRTWGIIRQAMDEIHAKEGPPAGDDEGDATEGDDAEDDAIEGDAADETPDGNEPPRPEANDEE